MRFFYTYQFEFYRCRVNYIVIGNFVELIREKSNVNSRRKQDRITENLDDRKLVTNPTDKRSGFRLLRKTRVKLNRIETSHGKS